MKNSIYVFFLALILFQACNENEEPIVEQNEQQTFTCIDANATDVITNDCIDDWECKFKLTSESSVDVSEIEGLSSGDKIVFQMINHTEGSLLIADDEFTNILVFELDESQEFFVVHDSEMEAMNVHFRTLCFCSNIDFVAVTSGCLQGAKQTDGTWLIQGHLTVPYFFGNIDLKFDAQFVN